MTNLFQKFIKNWVEINMPAIPEVNTKTFQLSGASDLTTAQAILDYYNEDNNPVIYYADNIYTISYVWTDHIDFIENEVEHETTSWTTSVSQWKITINFDSWEVTTIVIGSEPIISIWEQFPWMTILSYWHSTWQNFLDAYNKNAIVYTRASSNSNPASWSQTRMAFMAYVNNAENPTEVEFQYYRSRSDHNTQANQLDQVFVYKLTKTAWRTVTTRDTAAKPTAWTWVSLTYGSGNMVIANTLPFNPGNTWTTGQVIKKTASWYEWANESWWGSSYTAGDWIDITNDVISVDTTTIQPKLTAWTNISIANDWTISATDTTYSAWEWIEIWTIQDYSAMQWPAPEGFHVPLQSEWQAVYDIWTALGGWSSDWPNFWIALKLPMAGYRFSASADVYNQGSNGKYWSSSRYTTNSAYYLNFSSAALSPQNTNYRTGGYSVRCFKDFPTVPTSSWTMLYGTSIEAGWIFWNSTDWLISLSSDWDIWITIQDKNLWATTVWNSWDTLSEANCGKYYQRWNNYGFPRTWSVTTSSAQVDASAYWPWNYYSSSTFITRSENPYRWDTTDNWNLRWWETWVVTLDNAITNTGVLSVNWQTWDVTIQAGWTYTAWDWIDIDANNEISVDSTIAKVDDVNTKTFYLSSTSDLTTAQAAYDWHADWKNPIVIYNKEVYNVTNSYTNYLELYAIPTWQETGSTASRVDKHRLSFYHTNWVVSTISYSNSVVAEFLGLGSNYSEIYYPKYDWSPTTKKYVDDAIINNKPIAGNNITIEEVCTTEQDTKWPCESGFHIPLVSEWGSIINIRTSLWWTSSDWIWFSTALKLPICDLRYWWTWNMSSGTPKTIYYWASDCWWYSNNHRNVLILQNSSVSTNTIASANWCPVRPFKNAAVTPTSSWTKLYWTSIEAGGIFWSSTDWLISLSSDWQTWVTIADKNIWATTTYNYWDAFSESNCWKLFQRWNNYEFPYWWNITTSWATYDDVQAFGPWNYFYRDKFILVSNWNWTNNYYARNLWWWYSKWTRQDCRDAISSTWWLPSWWTVWQVLMMTADWPAWVTLS